MARGIGLLGVCALTLACNQNKGTGEPSKADIEAATAALAEKDAVRARLMRDIERDYAQTAPYGPVLQHLSRTRLAEFFGKLGVPIHLTKAVNGQRHFVGKHPDSGTIIELLGGADDAAESATLLVALNQNQPSIVIRNTGAIMVFMRETGFEDGHNWAIGKLKTGGKTTHAGVAYQVTVIAPGVAMISAEPK